MSRNFAPGPFPSSPRTFVFFLLLLQAYAEDKRPVWNMADEVNSIPEIDTVLIQGANAIQFVVTYSDDGVPQHVGDLDPTECPCSTSCGYSEDIPDYLDALLQHSGPGSPEEGLTLIAVYNKLENVMDANSKQLAGYRLAYAFLTQYLMKGGQAKILLIISSTEDSPFFQGFKNYLSISGWNSWTGYDVASNDEDLDTIHSMYSSLGIDSDHVWQSVDVSKCLNGIEQCSCNEIDGGFDRLDSVLERREGSDFEIAKVCVRVLDESDTIREVLRRQVDVVVTDYPDRLNDVLQEPEFASKFKLADRSDNPWELYIE